VTHLWMQSSDIPRCHSTRCARQQEDLQRLAAAVARRSFLPGPVILPCGLQCIPWQGPLEEGRTEDDMSDRLFMSPRSDLDPGTAPAGAHRYAHKDRSHLKRAFLAHC